MLLRKYLTITYFLSKIEKCAIFTTSTSSKFVKNKCLSEIFEKLFKFYNKSKNYEKNKLVNRGLS